MRLHRASVVLFALAASGAAAQSGPRLTGGAVVAELRQVQDDLQARAEAYPGAHLEAIAQRLETWRGTLEQAVGTDDGKPVDLMAGEGRALAMRAHAAALRAKAYLDSCTHCAAADAAAMAQALALTVERLADAGKPTSAAPAVIESIETADGRAIFALRGGGKPATWVLTGKNLTDPACPDPQLSATDAQGVSAGIQPLLLHAQPGRVEWTWPSGDGPAPGSYVLHLAARRKAFLRGCVAQPEAIGVVQIAPLPSFAVSYTLAVGCHEGVVSLHTGDMPGLAAYGATVTQRVEEDACADPVSYALSGEVALTDGSRTAVGPVMQSAAAVITAGLPGGLTLSWDPATRLLVARTPAAACKGID